MPNGNPLEGEGNIRTEASEHTCNYTIYLGLNEHGRTIYQCYCCPRTIVT